MTETKDMFEQISAILTDKKDKPFSYEELAAILCQPRLYDRGYKRGVETLPRRTPSAAHRKVDED